MRINWRTSLFGLIASIGMAMSSGTFGDNKAIREIGQNVAAIGVLLTGMSAKDHDK